MLERVRENVRNNRHPMDQATQRGALTVFVGNLPFSLDEEQLRKMFGAYGAITAVTIVKDNMNRSKGYGFVEVRHSSTLPIHPSIHFR